MGLAGERGGERFHVKKVATLELNPLAPTTLTARCLLLGWLGKPEEGGAAVEVLDAEEWLIVKRGKLEGEAADHRSVGVFQRRASRYFFWSSGRSRDPGGVVTNSEAREVERQVEADDEPSRLKRGGQKYLVDKIKDAEGLDASVLRRFGFQRLKLPGLYLTVE